MLSHSSSSCSSARSARSAGAATTLHCHLLDIRPWWLLLLSGGRRRRERDLDVAWFDFPIGCPFLGCPSLRCVSATRSAAASTTTSCTTTCTTNTATASSTTGTSTTCTSTTPPPSSPTSWRFPPSFVQFLIASFFGCSSCCLAAGSSFACLGGACPPRQSGGTPATPSASTSFHRLSPFSLLSLFVGSSFRLSPSTTSASTSATPSAGSSTSAFFASSPFCCGFLLGLAVFFGCCDDVIKGHVHFCLGGAHRKLHFARIR